VGQSGTFSSSAPNSMFTPLSESEAAQLRALYALNLARLKVVHANLSRFATRYAWGECVGHLLQGALIMITVDENGGSVPPPAAAGGSWVGQEHTTETDSGITPSGSDEQPVGAAENSSAAAGTAATAASGASSRSPGVGAGVAVSKPLSAALSCWQRSMQLATQFHMTHYLAHAHFLFGLYLRVQDPARRIHLQTARAIFIANGCAHYANLAAAALCHLSYFDLGQPLQNRLAPFTAYTSALLSLHAEKAQNFVLLTDSQRGVPARGILRRTGTQTRMATVRTGGATTAAVAGETPTGEATAAPAATEGTRSNRNSRDTAGVTAITTALRRPIVPIS